MLFKNITVLDDNCEIKETMYVGTEGSRITYIGTEAPGEDKAGAAAAVKGAGKAPVAADFG